MELERGILYLGLAVAWLCVGVVIRVDGLCSCRVVSTFVNPNPTRMITVLIFINSNPTYLLFVLGRSTRI